MDSLNLAYLTPSTAFLLAKDLVPQIEAVCLAGLTNHLENVVLIHCSLQKKGCSVTRKSVKANGSSQKKAHKCFYTVILSKFGTGFSHLFRGRVGEKGREKSFLIVSVHLFYITIFVFT